MTVLPIIYSRAFVYRYDAVCKMAKNAGCQVRQAYGVEDVTFAGGA